MTKNLVSESNLSLALSLEIGEVAPDYRMNEQHPWGCLLYSLFTYTILDIDDWF